MPVTIQNQPVTDGHTRYVIINAESPGMVTITGLIDYVLDTQGRGDEDELLGITLVTPDNESEQVSITKDSNGVWVVRAGEDGPLIEEIKFNPRNSDEVEHHEVWVSTFESDIVPVFLASTDA